MSMGYEVSRATESGIEALARIISNITNANSVGYKKETTSFIETLNGKIAKFENKDFSQGPLRRTSQIFDFALEGPGFFEVELLNGQRAYTRAGRFRLNNEGELVTDEGYRVIPEIEQTKESQKMVFEKDKNENLEEIGLNLKVSTPKLSIPPAVTPEVAQDGTIYGTNEASGEKTKLGKINVVVFNNLNGLESIGRGYFLSTKQSGQVQDIEVGPNAPTKVRQGFLEFGNVDLASELMSLAQLRNLLNVQFKTLKTLDRIYENIHYMISKAV